MKKQQLDFNILSTTLKSTKVEEGGCSVNDRLQAKELWVESRFGQLFSLTSLDPQGIQLCLVL